MVLVEVWVHLTVRFWLSIVTCIAIAVAIGGQKLMRHGDWINSCIWSLPLFLHTRSSQSWHWVQQSWEKARHSELLNNAVHCMLQSSSRSAFGTACPVHCSISICRASDRHSRKPTAWEVQQGWQPSQGEASSSWCHSQRDQGHWWVYYPWGCWKSMKWCDSNHYRSCTVLARFLLVMHRSCR